MSRLFSRCSRVVQRSCCFRRRSLTECVDGDVSLTTMQEGLVAGRAQDHDEEEIRAVTNGHFTTEVVNDFLALAHGAWLCIFGLMFVSLLGVSLTYGAVMLMKTMWYLSYLLMSIFAPLGFAFKSLWTKLTVQLSEGCTAVIHIHSEGQNAYLFQGMSSMLRSVMQSGEAELVVEREEQTVGTWSWHAILIPWKQKGFLRVTNGNESKMVELVSRQADSLVCGPKNKLVRPRDIELRIVSNSTLQMLALPWWPSNSVRLLARQKTDMKFLQNWVDDVYVEYMRAQRGTVEVLELQQDFADWPPEWQSVRKENAVRGEFESNTETWRRSTIHSTPDLRSTGYYFVQDWAERMMKHADFAMKHNGRMRTTLFLHGQKGSGKTLFVEWLASELGLPIYYIDLRSPFLNDGVLRDALTPRKLRHNLPVIFHFDEFQSMIEAWADTTKSTLNEHTLAVQPPPTRVTIQGLQSVLEGISTPNNALFVFTGSQDLPDLESLPRGPVRHEWEGVLRRFPVREMIPPIGRDAVIAFVCHFFSQYLPEGTIQKVQLDKLESAWDLNQRTIPFDMASKYCQHYLRDAFIEGLLVVDRNGLHVPPEHVDLLLERAFDTKGLRNWRDCYAGGKCKA